MTRNDKRGGIGETQRGSHPSTLSRTVRIPPPLPRERQGNATDKSHSQRVYSHERVRGKEACNPFALCLVPLFSTRGNVKTVATRKIVANLVQVLKSVVPKAKACDVSFLLLTFHRSPSMDCVASTEAFLPHLLNIVFAFPLERLERNGQEI
jgi:hypothetical protein